MNLVITILGLAATTTAALAAVGSWRAAKKANNVAHIITGIEVRRHHTELTPRFEIRSSTGSGETVELWLKLVGPIGIDRLDRMTATIVDDHTVGYFSRSGTRAATERYPRSN